MSGSPLPRVFGLLGLENDPAVDDALREALPHLGCDSRAAALQMICDRGNARVMHAIVIRCPSYDPELRDAVFQRIDEFQAGLRSAMKAEPLVERAAAIAVIAAARDFKSVPLLGDALRSHCPRTRELAGNAIKAFTHVHLVEPGDGQQARRLGVVLSEALSAWEVHHHAGVLESAMWMIHLTEPALMEKLQNAPSKITPALKTLLDRTSEPRLAAFALRALTHGELRAPAIRALARVKDDQFVSALLDEMWMFADPQFTRATQGIRDWEGLLQGMIDSARSHAVWSPAVVKAIASCRTGGEAAESKLAALDGQQDETLQRAVLWQLVNDESNAATQLLKVLALRANDARSPVAMREWARRARRVCIAPSATPGGVDTDPLQIALHRFLDEYDRLTTDERVVLSSQLKTFGAELRRAMERRLRSPLAHERAAAIRALELLDLVREHSAELYPCCHDPDMMVRLAALKALEADPSATVTRLQREALHDPEPRVQASAIELLEKRGIEPAARMVRDKLASPHSRVRANAIKALWTVQAREAADALEKMLKDSSAPHRISALWVIERLRNQELLAVVTEMERTDPDAAVRLRARRVLRAMAERRTRRVRVDDSLHSR